MNATQDDLSRTDDDRTNSRSGDLWPDINCPEPPTLTRTPTLASTPDSDNSAPTNTLGSSEVAAWAVVIPAWLCPR